MTKTIRFGTRVPQSIYPGIPGYIHEYDQNDQVWHPGTLEYMPTLDYFIKKLPTHMGGGVTVYLSSMVTGDGKINY